nr:TadE/TadG family type IV pilus assembly protein [Methylomarinum sp. Ch1-1]MDP4519871.1 TadE/TadG family type IV pilus assembly protein [Methylomarinum sp. Ch1-1]
MVVLDKLHNQKGAALIEFAIILPLLMLLVIGVVEFGFAFYHLDILNKSVQDGARYFADPKQARNGVIDDAIDVTGSNQDNVDATTNLIIYGSTDASTDSLLPNVANYTPVPSITTDATYTDHIFVTASYDHQLILGGLLSNLTNGTVPATMTLTASTAMRVE